MIIDNDILVLFIIYFVVIRTNGADTTLIIDAANDVVTHYGTAGGVNIKSVKDKSYHEKGTVSFLEVATGRVALENESNVTHIHLNATLNSSTSKYEFNNIIVSKSQSIEMPEFSRDPIEVSSEGTLVVALQDSTDDITPSTELDYVWLTEIGIYEQVTVSNSKSSAGNEYAATSSNVSEEKKVAAQQIANSITATNNDGDTFSLSAAWDSENEKWDYTLVNKDSGEQSVPIEVTVTISNNQVTNVTGAGINSTPIVENGLTEEQKNEIMNSFLELHIEVTYTINSSNVQVEKMSLAKFRDKWNNGDYDNGDVSVIVNCDLTLPENWEPIGTSDHPFYGTFDGNGKTISGLSYEGNDYLVYGLIGYAGNKVMCTLCQGQ